MQPLSPMADLPGRDGQIDGVSWAGQDEVLQLLGAPGPWLLDGLSWAHGALASVGPRGGSILQIGVGACGCVLGGVRLLSHLPSIAHVRQLRLMCPVVGGRPHSLSGGFWTAGCPAELGQGLLLSTPLLLALWERRLSLRVSHPCLCPGSRPDVRGPHATELACPIPSRRAGLTPLVLTLRGGGFCLSHFWALRVLPSVCGWRTDD